MAPDWAIQVIAALLILVVALYLFFFCYFAFKAPDNLRSEKFTIRKMEIERGLTGDDSVGLTDTGNSLIEQEPELIPDQGAK